MTNIKKFILFGSVALGIAACAESVTRFNSEAGSWIDEGGFGNPTMQNMLAQMCRQAGKSFKPGAVSDPVVVLDPSTAGPQPVTYRQSRLTCQDSINGKYAEVIFNEYVSSGESELVIETIEVESE